MAIEGKRMLCFCSSTLKGLPGYTSVFKYFGIEYIIPWVLEYEIQGIFGSR
jgi:hypothetical protein